MKPGYANIGSLIVMMLLSISGVMAVEDNDVYSLNYTSTIEDKSMKVSHGLYSNECVHSNKMNAFCINQQKKNVFYKPLAVFSLCPEAEDGELKSGNTGFIKNGQQLTDGNLNGVYNKGIRVKGFIKVTIPGITYFRTGHGDMSLARMIVNGKQVYLKRASDKKEFVEGIVLSVGYHPFEVIYYLPTGKVDIKFKISSDGRYNNSDLYHSEYYTQEVLEQFLAIISDLKENVNGRKELNDERIKTYIDFMNGNKGLFGVNADVIKATFDLVKMYDEKIGPLWIKQKDFNRNRIKYNIHFAIYNVMQNIVDVTYTSENIAAYGELIDGYKFGSSDYFPGIVEEPINKGNIHKVKINGSYPNTFGPMTMMDELPARKPTGTYLAPGTIATVTVPESIVGKGYSIRIGAHSWDNSRKRIMKRLDRCTIVYNIDTTEVKVASPLGGGIYIEVPYLSDAGIVEVKVENAVRSPYFSAKEFHMTSLDEWRNVERKFKAPWADFQSEKFMMQVPTDWIYNLDDPSRLMSEWDASMDIINNLMGFPEGFGKETMYPQVDLQNRSSVYAPGYPSVNMRYNPEKDYGGVSSHHLIRGPRYAADYEFHEEGHAYFFQKFPGERESTVNLLHVAVLNQLYGCSFDEALRSSRNSKNDFQTLETTAITWMTSPGFVSGNPMDSAEKSYQLKGHAKFVDIARLFGWDCLNRYWYSFNSDYENGTNYSKDIDSLLERLCIASGTDIRPLFHFWGVPPVNNDKLQERLDSLGLKPDRKIYEQILEYKSVIPRNNKEFQEYSMKWWGRVPSSKGFMTERNQAELWNTYNEEYADKIRNTVQNILDSYFYDL